jgi:hypothetical protein
MVWTALFFNKTTMVFNTSLNSLPCATAIAQGVAKDAGTEIMCIIKGNCKENAYFL